ncbi:hypothetical protein EOS_33000 [Caballeronia mineralivorans PML1(12)]|uniref:ApeA N-terminal domain-containing protein n=2 Tax=Caballeronia mineralivorans TaxID=2010198 RepID=A0A0J1CML2_9BURK|nr:hypothetical protein EOS_33000 [Caballeronia mineralivorans PML1(12)]
MTFAEEHTYAVELRHDELGDLGNGKLTFGGGQQVSAQLSMLSPIPHSEDKYPLGVVRAIDDKGKHYALCGCVAYGLTIYADYLITGEVPDLQFDRVDIRYSDISEWFLQWCSINGTVGDTLTWERLPQHIDTDFVDAGRQFNLTTEYVGTLDHRGEDHILHEHVDFCIQPTAGVITFDEARGKAMQLACLFSILVGHPISILELYLRTTSQDFCGLYFPTFKPVPRDLSNDRFLLSCFIQKHFLDGQWQTILQNFFGSEHRKIRWTRLAGMQRYDDFWEYEALGYVTLLDSYVSHHMGHRKGAVVAPPSRKMRIMEATLEQLAPSLNKALVTSILAAVSRIFSSRPGQSFSQKYEATIAASDVDVIRIINISDEDFQLIKKVRNNVAHGNEIGLDDDELQQIHVVVRRIELLLTYWAFVDFGLSKIDFLKGLNNPFSRLRRLTNVNAKHLARVTKTAEFFQVSSQVFGALSSQKGIAAFACFLEGPNGEIEFSDHFMQMQRDWQKARRTGMFTADQIFGVSLDAVRHVNHMYIECGEETLEFHGTYVFNQSMLNPA